MCQSWERSERANTKREEEEEEALKRERELQIKVKRLEKSNFENGEKRDLDFRLWANRSDYNGFRECIFPTSLGKYVCMQLSFFSYSIHVGGLLGII